MKPPIIKQRTMDWILKNTNIRTDESKLRSSRSGYAVSFEPTSVIINMDTGEQIDYSDLTPEDYINSIEEVGGVKK